MTPPHDGQRTASTCLTDLLLDEARRRPHDTAVVCGAERLTFRDLVRRSRELAGHLIDLGVRAEDCVGLFVEPSVDLMIGTWAILFAGAAYLPLSPEYPEERVRYMLENSGTRTVVAQPDLTERLGLLAPAGTRIVTLADVPADAPAVSVRPAPEHLAYVIYTSGSTGRPKGVMIEHRSIVSQLRWLGATYGLAEQVVLQKTPMSFDAAQWEILAPACGAEVVLGGPGLYRDVERLIETVRAHGVSTLQCVPTLLQALLDDERLAQCSSLRQIFTGGEALSEPLARRCLDTVPWAELINLYGPTECTINSSSLVVDPAAAFGDGPNSISIGHPVADTVYRILDAERRPVTVGEIGELYIGGIQLARGYLDLPELTEQRFVPDPFGAGKLFRTGDLAYRNTDGTVQFVGRVDNQVKLRGFRVELDEIRLAIETHDWVKQAAVLVKNDARTGFQNLIACVELNPREAALMDQGNHGAHHQSKESKLQVRAQLAGAGVRAATEFPDAVVLDLPGATATPAQRAQAFARKTYRFYEGDAVTRADVLALLRDRTASATPRDPAELGPAELGGFLRHLGQHRSPERLLPKYAYASPGSLYATQLYLEVSGIPALRAGLYYYHPVQHQLVLVTARPIAAEPRLRLHFVGRKQAIEPVYKNNIREVLEIETGHMVGLLEQVLPDYGLDIVDRAFTPSVRELLAVADEDYYLGTFDVVPFAGPRPGAEAVEVYVQAHPGRIADLPAGQYMHRAGRLERIGDDLVQRRHVIAINQAVYDRASLGISLVSRTGPLWRRYIDLGRTLQRLSMNDVGLGFMSSGYSSRTGDDLPSARRIEAILRGVGRSGGPSYFFVGGPVSPAQRRHEGMNEDVVHMRGPAELIRDDLATLLPDYMIPNKVVLFDALPTTVNGKIDSAALVASERTDPSGDDRPPVPPRTTVERRIAEHWKAAMRQDTVSVLDDFFASGGNSLVAVALINRLNREFAITLPLQVLFESPTIESLARRVGEVDPSEASRLVPLQSEGAERPVYCWPGLGGYTMNLRTLATAMGTDRPFYGVQAHGINPGETPYPTIREMAARDVAELRRRQPQGPYTLCGYSFGARVAFEAAYQLEQRGEQVDNLVLLAPGSPTVDADAVADSAEDLTGRSAGRTRSADYADPVYLTILLSVFAGTISGTLPARCRAAVTDEDSFVAFVTEHVVGLDPELIRRIIRVVGQTFEFDYTFRELTERRIAAPITILKARGDDYSFLEGSSGYCWSTPTVIDLRADHYSMLREPEVAALAGIVRERTDIQKGIAMPHVNIKHFPIALSDTQQATLVSTLTQALTAAFGCDEGAVSIAFEAIEQEVWNEQVYLPEIVGRQHILGKFPSYGPETN